MQRLGYAYLIDRFGLPVVQSGPVARTSRSVNRRVDTDAEILFPVSVALDDSPLGHLGFALRHEGVDLAVIAAALRQIAREDVIAGLRATPNGDSVRRIAFLWEWFYEAPLDAGVAVSARYVELFPSDRYVTAAHPRRQATYRVLDNALGDRRFCPVVSRTAAPGCDFLPSLLARLSAFAAQARQDGSYARTLQYLYLSETRGSFAIERETPSASKEARFVQLLHKVSEQAAIDEERLVEIQNASVRDVYSQEAGYRTRQNWLESHTGRIRFFPHPPEGLRETMAGWESFINDRSRGIDPLIQAACAAFGFVYLHPFMDGNGRLHRFLIHQVLAHSGLVPADLIVPVSAVIMKNIPEYHAVLTGFSEPTTRLWDYRRHDDGPEILRHPGPTPYRYFCADREVRFLTAMIQVAIEEEIPRELAYLSGYDQAVERIDAQFDLPQKDISRLVRMIQGNGGTLSRNKRSSFPSLPDDVVERVETIVRQAFSDTHR
ncbi:Fic family protein [Thiocapsa rosea]|uniref:Fic/DOC family protein n=1 Tax=Thiocapsa rosea TaxID=69360 RepID=A0A495V150_9GAMM|nr:Fic family protein [Thiocapsa rosea]RKT43126.1 Fic/DOC family protein [Thiocapsa rosea]